MGRKVFLHPSSSLELVRNCLKRRCEEPEMSVRLPDFMLLKNMSHLSHTKSSVKRCLPDGGKMAAKITISIQGSLKDCDYIVFFPLCVGTMFY